MRCINKVFNFCLLLTCLFMPLYALSSSFENIKKYLVIIETENGKMLGCFVKLDEQIYVLTSQHALFNSSGFTIKTLSGKPVTTISIETSIEESSLIRMRVEGITEALSVKKDTRNTNPVLLLKTDKNSGIISEISGFIKNSSIQILPTDIEELNGTPLISKDGKIIGIARCRGYNAQAGNWLTDRGIIKGKNICIFRIREGMQWQKIQWNDYEKQSRRLTQYQSFIKEYINIINRWALHPYKPIDFSPEQPSELRIWLKEHNDMTKQFIILANKIGRGSGIGLTQTGVTEAKLKIDLSDRTKRLINFCRTKSKALSCSYEWVSPCLKKEAEELSIFFDKIVADVKKQGEEMANRRPFSYRGKSNIYEYKKDEAAEVVIRIL